MRRVRWTPLAYGDFESIVDYVAEHSTTRIAAQIAAEIERSVAGLGRFPRMGRPGRVEGTRELALAGTPYLVVYEFRDDFVVVLRLLHGSRRWPSDPTP